MNTYHITGTLCYYKTCMCEYCEGHESSMSVSEVVVARTPEDAAERCLEQPTIRDLDHEHDARDILDRFTISELLEDQRLRMLGAPSLFPQETYIEPAVSQSSLF